MKYQSRYDALMRRLPKSRRINCGAEWEAILAPG